MYKRLTKISYNLLYPKTKVWRLFVSYTCILLIINVTLPRKGCLHREVGGKKGYIYPQAEHKCLIANLTSPVLTPVYYALSFSHIGTKGGN